MEERMFKNERFWYGCIMPGAVAGWIFIFFGLFFPIQNEILKMAWLFVAFLWGIGHILELAVSLPIGKAKGLPVKTIVIKTIVFGITWWLPLKMGYIEK
jgi:hypothetical protein